MYLIRSTADRRRNVLVTVGKVRCLLSRDHDVGIEVVAAIEIQIGIRVVIAARIRHVDIVELNGLARKSRAVKRGKDTDIVDGRQIALAVRLVAIRQIQIDRIPAGLKLTGLDVGVKRLGVFLMVAHARGGDLNIHLADARHERARSCDACHLPRGG